MIAGGAGQFEVFGVSHGVALVTIAVLAAGLAALLRGQSEGTRTWGFRRRVCLALACVLLGNVVAEQLGLLLVGRWSVQHSLPLHLCDLGVLVNAVILLVIALHPGVATRGTRRQVVLMLYELAYYWGLGGASQALLTPDLQHPFPGPAFFFYFIGHGAIVVSVVVLTLGLRLRPRQGSGIRVWMVTNLLAGLMLLINWLARSNYMFVCGPPDSATVLDYLGRWPLPFLISLSASAGAMIAFCYAPYWWLDRRR